MTEGEVAAGRQRQLHRTGQCCRGKLCCGRRRLIFSCLGLYIMFLLNKLNGNLHDYTGVRSYAE